jgi:hypothetical protein
VREDAAAKARRILGEGRVNADVRGDGAVYSTGRDAHGWWCSCANDDAGVLVKFANEAKGRCSHLLAVGLIVAVEPREAT